MKVLVTGSGGLLGGRIASLLPGHDFEVLAICRRTAPPENVAAIRLDLMESGRLEALLDAESPAAVIHAAAVGSADCLEQPARAAAVNGRLPAQLARSCRLRGIRLLALSTDLVLGGERAFSDEGVPPHPLSLYGRTKLAGEEGLLAADPGATVVRVPLVVGRGHGARGTASETVVRALASGRTVRLFTDEYRSPVDPESITEALARLLQRGGSGRYHVGGPERLTRHELGLRAARALGLPSQGIEAALRRDHEGPERRPADTSLDTTRARRELDWTPRPLDRALAESRLG